MGKDEGRSQKGAVDAVSGVAFTYDTYTNPSKNNGVLGATLTGKPPSILLRSDFILLARFLPVLFGEAELKERMKLSAFFSERVAW